MSSTLLFTIPLAAATGGATVPITGGSIAAGTAGTAIAASAASSVAITLGDVFTGLSAIAAIGSGFASAASESRAAEIQAQSLENQRRAHEDEARAREQQAVIAEQESVQRAKLIEQQAQQIRDQAKEEEDEFRRRQMSLVGSQRALLGASGAKVGTGVSLLLEDDLTNEISLQAAKIREGGDIEAKRFMDQASFERTLGSNDALAFRTASESVSRSAASSQSLADTVRGTIPSRRSASLLKGFREAFA